MTTAAAAKIAEAASSSGPSGASVDEPLSRSAPETTSTATNRVAARASAAPRRRRQSLPLGDGSSEQGNAAGSNPAGMGPPASAVDALGAGKGNYPEESRQQRFSGRHHEGPGPARWRPVTAA